VAFQTSTATDYVALLDKLVTYVTSNGVATAAVAAGGTGYVVGDILTGSGGTFSQAATFRVKTVSAGAVTAVVIVQNGAYTVNPSSPISTTGGTGSSCTLTVTFASTGWLLKRQSQQAVSATVGAGGATTYVVNDILTVVGGTAVTAAQFKVTTVSAGAVTAVILWRRGNYKIIPANAVATTGGGGTGCTLNVTWAGVALTANKIASTAAVAAAGTGYTNGDVLTVSGGTGTAAKFRVTAVGGGGTVTTVTAHEPGDYSATPSNPASTTGGTGTSCTLTITYLDAQPNPDKEVILQGVGSGSDEVFVGIRTFNDSGGGGAHNWELAGFTGYNAAATFETQPGISPGRWDGGGAAQEGAYVPLTNGTITYWLVANGRRIAMVARMGSTYTNLYLGLINPFGTTSQYPYPLIVLGCSSLWNRLFSAAVIEMSGLTDPVSHGATAFGPGFVRDPGGSWISVANSGGAASSRTRRGDCNVWPCGSGIFGSLSNGPDVPAVGSPGFDVTKVIPGDGSPGTVVARIFQITDTPSDKSTLWPTMVIERSPAIQALGELHEVYWVSAIGNPSNLVAEDTITIGDETFRVFQNCNRTDVHSHFAMKEA